MTSDTLTASPDLATASLIPELVAQLEQLSEPEQRVVADLLATARPSGASSPPFDTLGLIHEQLKARMDFEDFGIYQELSAVVAPPMVESFPNAPFVALPTDLPPLEAKLDTTIGDRFSSHNFGREPVPLTVLASLLHHACGVKRTARAYNVREFPIRRAPSAGGLQPIDVQLIVNGIDGLARGRYYYDPLANGLRLLDEGNLRFRLMRSCIFQEWMSSASVVFVLVANMPRVVWKYGERAYRFVHVDAGVLTQNLYLVATALKLNICAVAAYYDDLLNDLLGLDGRNQFTVLLMAIGPKPFGKSAPEVQG